MYIQKLGIQISFMYVMDNVGPVCVWSHIYSVVEVWPNDDPKQAQLHVI